VSGFDACGSRSRIAGVCHSAACMEPPSASFCITGPPCAPRRRRTLSTSGGFTFTHKHGPKRCDWLFKCVIDALTAAIAAFGAVFVDECDIRPSAQRPRDEAHRVAVMQKLAEGGFPCHAALWQTPRFERLPRRHRTRHGRPERFFQVCCPWSDRLISPGQSLTEFITMIVPRASSLWPEQPSCSCRRLRMRR